MLYSIRFGQALSLSSDTLLVGAHGERSNAAGIDGPDNNFAAGNAGAAYVFVVDNAGNWSQQAYVFETQWLSEV